MTPHIERLRNDSSFNTPNNFDTSNNINTPIKHALLACSGSLINPLDPAILSLAQNNFGILTRDSNRHQNYCQLLCKVTEGLVGFFLPRPKSKIIIGKENSELITPTALLLLANDGKNSFYVKSYECIIKNSRIRR
jgi:hypothetical protein